MTTPFSWRRASVWLVIALAVIFEIEPTTADVCDLKAGATAAGDQLCRLACRAQGEFGDAGIKSSCGGVHALLLKQFDAYASPFAALAACGKGGAIAAWENLRDFVSMKEYAKFVRDCANEDACKLGMARELDEFKERGDGASPAKTDAEILSNIKPQTFNDISVRAERSKATSAEVCRRERVNVQRRLRVDFGATETPADEVAVHAREYEALSTFDPTCPRLLGLADPTQGRQANPDLRSAAHGLRLRSRREVDALASSMGKWLEGLDVALYCKSAVEQRELFCFALGKALLDPLTLATGGLFAAAVLRKAKKVAKAVEANEVAAAIPDSKIVAKAAGGKSNVFDPMNVPDTIVFETLRSLDRRATDLLQDLGVEIKPSSILPLVRQSADLKSVNGPADRYDWGTVYEVKGLPKPLRKGTAKSNALKHPQMPAYLKRLESMGYTLHIDTTMGSIGYGAYVDPESKILVLRAQSPWSDLVHEFQHVEFNVHIGSKRIAQMVELRAEKKKLTGALPADVVAKIGVAKLKRIERLIDRGITPELAINESLSVAEELRSMGWRRYVPASQGIESYRYMLRHQITAVEKLGDQMTRQQQTLVARNKVIHENTKVYDRLDELREPLAKAKEKAASAMVSTGVVVTPASALLYYAGDGKPPLQFTQILFNDVGDAIVQGRDRVWRLVQLKVEYDREMANPLGLRSGR